MAKSAEHIRACELRRSGKSIKSIAKILSVGVSTVSVWTRDIELTEAQRMNLRDKQIAAGHAGRILGAESNKQKKILREKRARDDARSQIQSLSRENLFFTGLGLYWGEGSKSPTSALSIANSDPRVIILMKRWFEECFSVEEHRFAPRIFISDTHQDREEILVRFWSDTLRLPTHQFRKTVFLPKGKKIYENRDMYYGVLALGVTKGGDIRTRILAQTDRVAEFGILPV